MEREPHKGFVHKRLTIIPPNWKQLECPSTGEWINKSGYDIGAEYYSARDVIKLRTRKTTRMDLEAVLSKGRVMISNLSFQKISL